MRRKEFHTKMLHIGRTRIKSWEKILNAKRPKDILAERSEGYMRLLHGGTLKFQSVKFRRSWNLDFRGMCSERLLHASQRNFVGPNVICILDVQTVLQTR